MTDILPPAGWPNVRQLETNEFATGGANGNMNEQAKSLAARSELLKKYATLPYESKTGGYALNERVQIATGDIVRSTIASNVNNPNVDMTGWENKEKEQDKINSLLPTYADKSESLQAAISNATNGDTINLSGKTYPQNISVDSKHLVGTGYNTVINVTDGNYGIKSLRTLPTWDRYKIKDLTLKGVGQKGTGFTFDPEDHISGRRNIEYVSFLDLDIGIHKPSGNIGNTYSNVDFDQCNYGFKATHNSTGGTMHSGCDIFRDAQFSNIQKWAVDITNHTDGGGQVSIQDSILQFCQGGGIRIDYNNIVPFTPLSIRNVWFEGVATASTINRDGVEEKPREIKLINTPFCVVDECYLKNVELINSTMLARACRVDDASRPIEIITDKNSQVILEDVYLDGSIPTNVFVRSIARQARKAPANITLRGYELQGTIPKPNGSFSAIGIPFSGLAGVTTFTINGSISSTARCVKDDTLSGTCAELDLRSDVTNVIGLAPLTINKWVVWGLSAKAISVAGKFEFFYGTGETLGALHLKTGEWVHNFGIAKVSYSFQVSARFEPSQNGIIRLANYFMVEFNTEAEAIEFVNSRMAVDTTVKSVEYAYTPTSLAVNELKAFNITLDGARLGEPVRIWYDQSLQGTQIWADITGSNTVTVYHKNTNITPVQLATGKLRVERLV